MISGDPSDRWQQSRPAPLRLGPGESFRIKFNEVSLPAQAAQPGVSSAMIRRKAFLKKLNWAILTDLDGMYHIVREENVSLTECHL